MSELRCLEISVGIATVLRQVSVLRCFREKCQYCDVTERTVGIATIRKSVGITIVGSSVGIVTIWKQVSVLRRLGGKC